MVDIIIVLFIIITFIIIILIIDNIGDKLQFLRTPLKYQDLLLSDNLVKGLLSVAEKILFLKFKYLLILEANESLL